MARELRRLLIDPDRMATCIAQVGRLPLRREEDHYLSRVLRLRPGDPLLVVDGCGRLWRASRGEGAWLEALQCQADMPVPPPAIRLCLALALPRREVELVWRMATELGIDRLQPLQAERCQISARSTPQERWSAVVREATEQCERLWLPRLEATADAADWLSRPTEGLKLLATTRRQLLPDLEQRLEDARGEVPGMITLAIGPEGGWSPDEEDLAEACGWHPVSLGQTILRTTTAAVAGVSRLAAWRQQLSC